MFKIIIALILICQCSLFPSNEGLRSEILEARALDQKARQKVIEAMNGSLQNQIPVEIQNEIIEIDQAHNFIIKKTIETFGWPGLSLIGKDGSSAFWLLVQHQDRDIALQVKCLNLLEEAVNKGEASHQDLAFLMDRVLKNQNLPQLYGTQWKNENGKMILYPVQDPEFLDARREQMHLSTFEDYKKELMQGLNLSEDAFK
jgi:hypothetical protein